MNKDGRKLEKQNNVILPELSGSVIDFSQLHANEIEMRRLIDEELRMESEQNAYMDRMFTC